MLEVELLIRNKKSQYLIRYMLDKVGADLDHGLVKFDNSEGWSKFSFQDKQGLKCPFSIWFSIGTAEHCFFNIGDQGGGATVFHNVHVADDFDTILLFFDDFAGHSIEEIKTYCAKRLKVIDYKILADLPYSRFRFLQETFFFCKSKSVERKIYDRWY
jgi:hypothetical protein